MTAPLVVLAVGSVLLGFIGTPAWPWFAAFLEQHPASFDLARITEPGVLGLMGLSSVIVLVGIGVGYWLYGRKPVGGAGEVDVLERVWPDLFGLLRNKYFVDEVFEWAFVSFTVRWARFCDWLDEWVWRGLVELASYAVVGLSWADRLFDEYVVNLGFDGICRRLTEGGGLLSRLQNGRVQHYLRIMGVGLALLVLLLIWGCRAL